MHCQVCGEDSEEFGIINVRLDDGSECFPICCCDECLKETEDHLIVQCERCRILGLWKKVDCYQAYKAGLEQDSPELWKEWLLWWHQAAMELIIFLRLPICVCCEKKVFISESGVSYSTDKTLH